MKHLPVQPVLQFNGNLKKPSPAHSVVEQCDGLTLQEVSRLSHGRYLHMALGPGETLFQQGDSPDNVYVLISGSAFCYKIMEDGRRQILDLLLPGSVLGFSPSTVTHCGAEAKTACRFAVLPRNSFMSALMANPELCLKCANHFALAETRAFDRMSRTGRLGAVERVAGLIVELATRLHAHEDAGTLYVSLPLKQAEIADMLGLAKESVCRSLKTLKKLGLANWHNGTLTIHQFETLAALSGEDYQMSGATELATARNNRPLIAA